MLKMSEISPIWAPIPPSIFIFSRENPRKSLFFGSCGEYAQLLLCLPKYGRFAPHLKPAKGPGTEEDFIIQFSPSGPHKPCQNTTMRVIFSNDNSIKTTDGKEPGNGKIVVSLG
jgi:hypothetical protein